MNQGLSLNSAVNLGARLGNVYGMSSVSSFVYRKNKAVFKKHE